MLYYLESPSTDPYFNLALEQYLFDALPQAHEYVMLWQNDNAIVVGKHQNTDAELNATYVKEHGIRVVRRLSGGGAVYHDLGNLNFTFIMDAGQALDLGRFCQPIAQVLCGLGVEAEVNGRNDITIDGMKFSGNAQYLKQGRVMHHGTILFDSDLTILAAALKVSPEKLRSKAVASVRSRVTTLRPYLPSDMTLERLKVLLLEGLFEGKPMTEYHLTPEDHQAVEILSATRYATWEWNWGRSPTQVRRTIRRVEGCGTIEVFLETDGGRIHTIQFRGDYFSTEDPEVIHPLLQGLLLEEDALQTALAQTEIERYFTGLSTHDFIQLLLS